MIASEMSVVVSVVVSKTAVKNGCTSCNDGVVKQTCATAAPMAHAALAPTVQSVVGAQPQISTATEGNSISTFYSAYNHDR